MFKSIMTQTLTIAVIAALSSVSMANTAVATRIQTNVQTIQQVLPKTSISLPGFVDINVLSARAASIASTSSGKYVSQALDVITDMIKKNNYNGKVVSNLLVGITKAAELNLSAQRDGNRVIFDMTKPNQSAILALFVGEGLEAAVQWAQNEQEGFLKVMDAFVDNLAQNQSTDVAFYNSVLAFNNGDTQKANEMIQNIIKLCGPKIAG